MEIDHNSSANFDEVGVEFSVLHFSRSEFITFTLELKQFT